MVPRSSPTVWIRGGAAAQPKHNPAPPAEGSTQSSPRGATAGEPTNEEEEEARGEEKN